ncbi:MAG TPA: PfkB family carbohydrate kinase [Terracidiphilus sp.]|jgi:sugar/nucleoside kinase (ribokinase family)
MAVGVFVGLSTIDLIHTVDDFPSPNSKTAAHTQELIVGGPATNAAIAFSYLGGNAALVTAVGQNRLAAIIKDELERYSIDLVDLAPEYDGLPAISSVWVDGRGRRSVVSVNALQQANYSPDVDAAVLANTRILQVDGHSMEACQAWARAAHSSGIPVVFDGGSWKEGTGDLLAFVDTAICSADFRPPGCADLDQVIRYLQARDIKHIAITRGAEPIRFLSGASAGSIPVPQIEVVDTTGAGDILHGAFCYFAAAEHDFVESLRKAVAVASESCRYPGTRRWMQAG